MGKNKDIPRCPMCGEETDFLYRDRYGDIFGCTECVELISSWQHREEI